MYIVAWSSWSARQSVTLEVAGSSPVVTANRVLCVLLVPILTTNKRAIGFDLVTFPFPLRAKRNATVSDAAPQKVERQMRICSHRQAV